ncbi:hypothetical protein PTTG_06219 [Puccinia triticina 1-1 BBBD Race 1]|uniref:Major facilitator superfamily (MFS) profile domain-containing protein n=1 Tax=Puccinia triticina (isolate 1-1 / race 1 (BBBD)) TaxID=630390 RepID=A0A180GS63_PUCT1|nr:hypothetical protein PTTG_06219 [Puccinia triticina 1-1 BBBD Race 1]
MGKFGQAAAFAKEWESTKQATDPVVHSHPHEPGALPPATICTRPPFLPRQKYAFQSHQQTGKKTSNCIHIHPSKASIRGEQSRRARTFGAVCLRRLRISGSMAGHSCVVSGAKGPADGALDAGPSSASPHAAADALQTARQKRAILKLDLLVVPILGLFFLLSALDQSNIGLQKDLRMSDYDFSMALTLVELPSNLLVQKIGAGIQIPLIVTVWGLITCLQGLVTSYRGLLATRFFLGLVEGALGPATVLYMTTFYTRSELQFRIAMFLSTVCIAAAVSGLLTYEIVKLDGRWGHPGWAWVFLIEGFVTSIIGLTGFYFLPSSIENAILLTNEDKTFLVSRLKAVGKPSSACSLTSVQEFSPKSTKYQVLAAFKSPHVILMSVAQFASTSNIYGLGYFTPTAHVFEFADDLLKIGGIRAVVMRFGYSPRATQLLTVPPFIVAFIYILGLSYWSDRYQSRGLAGGTSAALAIIGFSIFYGSTYDKLRYASLFLSIPGAYGVMPSLAAWTADNSEPHVRKASALACGGMVANVGGLFSVWIFTLGQPPRYSLPTEVNLFLLVICIILRALHLLKAN